MKVATNYLLLLAVVRATLGLAHGVHELQKRPNIFLIVGDDQGHSAIGYHNSTVLTPRLNELAREGVTLENYYVQPVCSPTRSSLMTGRYTNRLGTQATVIRSDVPFGVPLDNTFLSQNMQDAGYHTALFGSVSYASSSEHCLRLFVRQR